MPLFEKLESRRLYSVNATDGILTVQGDPGGHNNLALWYDSSDGVWGIVNNYGFHFKLADVREMRIVKLAEDDSVRIDPRLDWANIAVGPNFAPANPLAPMALVQAPGADAPAVVNIPAPDPAPTPIVFAPPPVDPP